MLVVNKIICIIVLLCYLLLQTVPQKEAGKEEALKSHRILKKRFVTHKKVVSVRTGISVNLLSNLAEYGELFTAQEMNELLEDVELENSKTLQDKFEHETVNVKKVLSQQRLFLVYLKKTIEMRQNGKTSDGLRILKTWLLRNSF